MNQLAELPALDPLRIAVLAEPRYLAQNQPQGLCAALHAAGQAVTLVDAGVGAGVATAAGSDFDDFDLIVARGRSPGVLGLLARAEACGKPTLNRRAAIAAVHNKAEMAVVLANGEVPMPRTFVGRLDDLADCVPAACYPLILKPQFGDNGRGLRIVDCPHALRHLQWPEPTALAQHYLANDGFDLKLYGIGNQLWAVRKRSPLAGPHPRPAEPWPLTPELAALGRRCGRLFGLHFYGVDCIATPDGPVVIEVNDFPNYTGVPDADRALARYAVDYAQQSARKLS